MVYKPRTVSGSVDRRYQRKCKFCQAGGLYWLNDGNGYSLVNVNNERHQCSAYRSTAFSSSESVTPPVTPPVTTLPQSEIDRVIENVTRHVNLSYLGTVAEATVSLNKKLEGTVSEISSKVESETRRIIKEMVPVEHTIKVCIPNVADRTFKGRPHEKLETLLGFASLGIAPMMVGPAGSGKTSAAHMVAEALELPFHEKSMGLATSEYDLLGYRTSEGVYVPGILREPFENGGVLMLDEMDNSNPSVLTTLNSALENDLCTFPDKAVKRHPDFVCIAGGNTYGRGSDRLYVGRTQLDAATLDRFTIVDWDYDEEAEFDWAGRDQYRWIDYVQRVRHAAFDHQMRVVISPRASIKGAKALRGGMPLAPVLDGILWKGMPTDDRNRLENIVGTFSTSSIV